MIKSLAVRDTLQRDAMKELELWPRKLEGLLGLQHDLQLEYKSAAEELLKLRDSRSELAQALKAEQAGGWASGLVSLESSRIFYMFWKVSPALLTAETAGSCQDGLARLKEIGCLGL